MHDERRTDDDAHTASCTLSALHSEAVFEHAANSPGLFGPLAVRAQFMPCAQVRR